MRLRTAESFWLLKNGLVHTYPSIESEHAADIAVVGAGITGALVSHALQEQGYKVIVVDKRDVAFGSTSATTSMLQYEIDEMLIDLQDMIGEKGAQQCYLAGVSALDHLARVIKKEKIDCGFEKKDSVYLSHDQESSEKLKEEFFARKKAGLRVSWLSATQIQKKYKMKSYGGILSKDAASVDAYKLAQELIYKNSTRLKNPLKVFDQSVIRSVKETKNSVHIDFENGAQIRCKKIVYCTGFESVDLIKEKIVDLFDTYACVSEPMELSKVYSKTLFWNTKDPYLYMRATDDNRFLVGGEDSSWRVGVLRERIKSYKSDQLIKELKKIALSITFIEDFTWAGTFGKTKDGLPYIGQSPEYKHSYFVLGFGGNGITFSVQAMKLLPGILKGNTPELAHYYRFGR